MIVDRLVINDEYMVVWMFRCVGEWMDVCMEEWMEIK